MSRFVYLFFIHSTLSCIWNIGFDSSSRWEVLLYARRLPISLGILQPIRKAGTLEAIYGRMRSVTIMDHMNSTNNNNFHEIRSPGFISTKSSVFEDALEVQHQPFSAVSSSDKEVALDKTISSLGIFSVVATAMAVLSIVLIIRFDFKQGEDAIDINATGWGGKVWYDSLLDTGTVLSSFCVMLNLHCVIVCTSQGYFASKMIKLPHGGERSSRYLKNTAGLRFFAISSFAVSIPVFIIALCSYLLLEFRLVAASVSSGLLFLGILMILFSFLHSVILWKREEKSVSELFKPKINISHIDSKFAFCNHVEDELNFTDSNLSTLV